jgi:hypothetical protein
VRTRARLPALIVAISVFVGVQVLGGVAIGTTTVQRFLPDVVPLTISAAATNPVEIEIATSGGHEHLHFALKTENAGAGPLELRPRRQDCNGNGNANDDRTAFQRIYGDTNGNGHYDPPGSASPDQVVRTVKVGCFVFDPAHGHWHFKNYAKYTLLDVNGTVVGSRKKVGFCLSDDTRVDPTLPGSPATRYYFSCADLAIQGTSVGWDDVYDAYTPGQSIVIDGLPDGDYCLVERADPANVLRELDDTNNVLRTPIQIAGTTVTDGGTAC